MKYIFPYSFYIRIVVSLIGFSSFCTCESVAGLIALKDSVELDEVTIVAQFKRYQVGAKITVIPDGRMELMNDISLEKLLRQMVAIPIKSNAGSLSTIRLRGTSPNHTSINVGGINVNSLTLGSSNLSSIPLFFFDELALQYGGASVVNGSGSIGGSLELGSKMRWVDGVRVEGQMTLGSFGEQFYGAKVYAGNGKHESVTKIYFFDKQNNFLFYHPPVKDFETGEMIRVKDTQRNASITNRAVMQEFGYKFSAKQYLRFMLWVEDDWHQIQQNMSTNLNQPDKSEEIEDKHIRIWSFYRNNRNKLKRYIGAGYVLDNEIYNKNTDNPIGTQRCISEGNIEYPVFSSGMIKGGFKSEIISPDVYAYDINGVVQYQNDLYVSYLHTLFSKLKVSVNLRKGFVTDFTVPFTPAFGISYTLLSRETSRLDLSGNIANSYRIPTFNDRFWIPGGNPDLLPENVVNYEVGGKYLKYTNKVEMQIMLNAFYMDVDDWILWKNSGAYWTAENVQRVVSKGIELQSNIKVELNRSTVSLGLNYTINSAERVESTNATAALDRQLEYVPLHTFSMYSQFNMKKWNFNLGLNGVSWQYTNEEPYNILDGYVLTNISVDRQVRLKNKHNLRLVFYADNIFNVNYYSSWNYAMPRMNFRGKLSYFFNKH